MKKTSIATAALLLTLSGGLCLAQDALRYVTASRLPLRAAPNASAAAQGYVTSNSQLRLLGNAAEWCEVQDVASSVRGFCQCKYLGDKPLGMAEIKAHLAGPGAVNVTERERLDWLSRAFWVEPSLSKLVAVGTAMQPVLLSAETRQKEISGQKALRFKTPEFEAMKKRVAEGVVSTETVDLGSAVAGENIDRLKDANSKAKLPKISPSLFHKGDAFAMVGAPFGLDSVDVGVPLVERLSAFHKLPYRVQVTAPAGYAALPSPSPSPSPSQGSFLDRRFAAQRHGSSSQSPFLRVNTALDIIFGAWDISQVLVSFDTLPKLQGITRKGEPTEVEVASVETGVGVYEPGCGSSSMRVKTREVKGKAPWSEALLSWVGNPAIKGKSTVRERKISSATPMEGLVIDDIDLDGDGVADFSVWTGSFKSSMTDGEARWQVVYANIAGKWLVVSYAEDVECS